MLYARATGHRIQQHDHILTELDQTLRAFNRQFGDHRMVGSRTVKGRGNHFTLHGAFHIRDLFRTFVHEHDHEMDFRVVHGNRVRDGLQGDGLAGLRRGDNQTTLALANGGDKVMIRPMSDSAWLDEASPAGTAG